MREDTKQAKEEFEKRTGLTVTRIKNRQNGSMAPYLFIAVKCTDETFYKKVNETHNCKGIKVEFIDVDFDYKYNNKPISEIRLDVPRTEFKVFSIANCENEFCVQPAGSKYYPRLCQVHGFRKEMAYREKQNRWAEQDAIGVTA